MRPPLETIDEVTTLLDAEKLHADADTLEFIDGMIKGLNNIKSMEASALPSRIRGLLRWLTEHEGLQNFNKIYDTLYNLESSLLDKRSEENLN